MALVDTERAFLHLCCDKVAPQGNTELDPAHAKVWSIYRHMVRQRLFDEGKGALRRTFAAVGEAAFGAMFDDWMQVSPPRARAFYGVVPELAAFAAQRWSQDDSVPPWSADLVRYEGARYAVTDLPARRDVPVAEFDFERVPVLFEACDVLSLSHRVHREPDAHGRYEAAPTALLIYRASDERSVGVYALNAFNAACFKAWHAGAAVSPSVREVAQAQGVQATAQHVDALCTVLSDLMERGVVLGSRP